ncbi:restriction endonuclease subunit S [Escherichia coli]|uniref:restriction endonuclease subunit S n=1 Tax=Escherichia coli TaxID=562 RepID=UPI0004D48DCD|nr:restriction endonuclease subunit S [Escherichia coli]EFH3397354.1 restriction endonuclease subunit S [Escherichia coli]EFJ2237410.1 restriction endonuclease subunit S [Escherichia coli]EFO4448499.1 restriction endonuclease subunit S [Escherichia coli]EGJ7450047.1 restriction endonuclease subunit S [Escherichia coli]EGW8330138.1 restriction endonuclease subunit S [Escherichia coli]
MESITSTLKYDQYSDSGYEWIGEIPEHWDLVKLGSCLSPVSVKNCPELPLLSITREQGVIERDVDNQESNHNFIPDDLSGYKKLEKGQFGMNKMKAWQGSYGVSKFTGIVSPAYFIFDFTKAINPEFFNWAIRSKLYVSFFGSASDGVRIGQWDLSKARMKVIPFVLPSEEEQSLIANFLDKKTALIDEAISIKEQQISLLKERKQIIIQQAVTQGLDPNVPMKDSGVDWIGKIPAHWNLMSLRYAFEFLNSRRVPISAVERESRQGVYPYYGASGVIDYVDDYIFDEDLILIAEDGANLLSKSTPLAFVATGKYWVNNHAHIIKPKFHGFKYWAELLSGLDYTVYISGAAQPKLTRDRLASVLVPVPPKDEIQEIISFIEGIEPDLNRTIDIQKSQIEKLKEYKTTLINSAVTGKIKITPEMVEQ